MVTGECDIAFRKLKENLCSKSVTGNLDFEKELILPTDVSKGVSKSY